MSRPLGEWASCFICHGTHWRTYESGSKLDEIPGRIGNGGKWQVDRTSRYILPLDMPDCLRTV